MSYPAVHQPVRMTLSAAFEPTFVTVTSADTGCPGATDSGRVCLTDRAG